MPRAESAPVSAPVSSEDVSGRALPFDVVRRDLQSGALSRDTEVFYAGLDDWTPASEIAELWVAPPPASPDDASDDAPGSMQGDGPRSNAPPPRKPLFGGAAILGVLLGLFALLGAGAYAIYFVYFRYVPVAVQHLPSKCLVTARVDLIDWAFFKPLTQRVAPAVEDALRPKPPIVAVGPPGPTLKHRMRTQAGINLDRDVREIAVCVYEDTSVKGGPESPDPLGGFRAVVAIGGRLHPGAIPGVFEAIRTEGWAAPLKLEGSGEAAVIRVPGTLGGVIGQAEDGTIVFAPNDATLAKMRQPRDADEALASTGITQHGSFELTGDHVAFALASAALSPTRLVDQDEIDALAHVQSGRLAIDVSGDPKVQVTLEEKREVDAKDVESQARRLIGVVRKELAATSKDHAGEQAALASALVKRDDVRVDVELQLRFADVDRGASELATMIRDDASPLRTSIDVATGRRAPPPATSGSVAPSASVPAPSAAPSKTTRGREE